MELSFVIRINLFFTIFILNFLYNGVRLGWGRLLKGSGLATSLTKHPPPFLSFDPSLTSFYFSMFTCCVLLLFVCCSLWSLVVISLLCKRELQIFIITSFYNIYVYIHVKQNTSTDVWNMLSCRFVYFYLN